MKNFTFVFVSVTLVLCSCNRDDTLYPDLNAGDLDSPTLQLFSVIPANNMNPYDSVGEEYRQTLDQYIKVDAIGLTRERSSELTDQSSKHNPAVENLWLTIEEIIAHANLTLGAQISLLDFIRDVTVQHYDIYEVLYADIIRYESEVMDDSRFTGEDKRLILIFTSLIRHTSYSNSSINMTKEEEEEPDDDWDNMVANRIGFTLVALEETLVEITNIQSAPTNKSLLTFKQ